MEQQEKKPFVPFTTEQKREYGKQFSPKEHISYRKGQRNAYSHMANTAKRQSIFAGDNIKDAENAPVPLSSKNGKVPPLTELKTSGVATKTSQKADTAPKNAPVLPLKPDKVDISTNNGQAYVTKVYEPAGKGKK